MGVLSWNHVFFSIFHDFHSYHVFLNVFLNCLCVWAESCLHKDFQSWRLEDVPWNWESCVCLVRKNQLSRWESEISFQLFIPNFSQVWSLQAVRAFREDILYATMLPSCNLLDAWCLHWISHGKISQVVGCTHRPSCTNLGCGSSKHRSSHSCDLMQER